MNPPNELPSVPGAGIGAVQLSQYRLSEAFAPSLKAAKICGYKFEDFDEDVAAFDNPRYILPAPAALEELNQPASRVALQNAQNCATSKASATATASVEAGDDCRYADLDDLTSDLSSLASSMSIGSDGGDPIPGNNFPSECGSSSDTGHSERGGGGSESDADLLLEEPKNTGPFLAWRCVNSLLHLRL